MEVDVTIYSDGACRGNPGPAGAGVVVVARDPAVTVGRRLPPGALGRVGADGRMELQQHLGVGTNNRAELEAIRLGLAFLAGGERLRIQVLTDSQWAIGTLTQGWRVRKHRHLVREIRELMARFARVELAYVPGHDSDPGNARADRLASDAATGRGMGSMGAG